MVENLKDPAAASWHIDRRIPLALIFALGIQTAGVAFWLGQISVKLASVEARVAQTTINNDRLTRIEVEIKALQVLVEKIEAKVD